MRLRQVIHLDLEWTGAPVTSLGLQLDVGFPSICIIDDHKWAAHSI